MHEFNLLQGVLVPGRTKDGRSFVNHHNRWMTMHITGAERANGLCPFYRVKIIFIPGSPKEITDKTRFIKVTRLVYR